MFEWIACIVSPIDSDPKFLLVTVMGKVCEIVIVIDVQIIFCSLVYFKFLVIRHSHGVNLLFNFSLLVEDKLWI